MPTWRRIQEPGSGFIYDLSESLAIIDWRNPTLLHTVRDGAMVIASDYSGQHKGATHEAYSFLVTTDSELRNWLPRLREFRNEYLPDGRRISFKDLREPVRWRALLPFLNTASAIRGNVITILIDHKIESFITGGAAILPGIFPDCFSTNMKSGTMEKMLRLASFVAMLTAGFRRERQESFWVSDHDETLATRDRREQLGRLANYLTFGIARWNNPADMNFGTTESSYLPKWVEDAVSIPDLIAGTYCNLSAILPTFYGTETWIRVASSSDAQDRRARAVSNWMATKSGPLRSVLLRLEVDETGKPRTSAQIFRGRQTSPNQA